jgi:hypothetical protein
MADFKPVKQEVNGTMILPPLVFPAETLQLITLRNNQAQISNSFTILSKLNFN